MAALGAPGGIDFALRVLLKFVTVEERDLARRPVRLSELTERERYVVHAFIEARLIRSYAAEGAVGSTDGHRDAYAEVTHEALFRQWAPLRQEAEARAERLRERAELERWAADWERSSPAARLFTRRGAGLCGTTRKGRFSRHGSTIPPSRQHRFRCYRLPVNVDSIGVVSKPIH